MATKDTSTPPSVQEVLAKAGKRALGGGGAGAAAMVTQVCTLMWLRTTMNYQYRYGTSTPAAIKALYKQGGVLRFYRGIGPALLQGPLSRFGDTAANTGILTLLDSYESTRSLPVAVKTVAASGTAALWRVVLMPIDTLKTVMQVEGHDGMTKLRAKLKAGGPRVLYHGSLAALSATFVGHFPWFATFNYLNATIPEAEDKWAKLARRAAIGFCSSVISDTTSNSIRVTKVTKQAHTKPITYVQAVREVISKDGVSGLFFRGLGTRLIANGMQGMMFTVVWKGLEERFTK
ncbi:MC family transporter [Salpingoeca rosetta]|uniref:MC family transporter n=1 Tax=Salpingoeca rosetta (strain ATCC 50818 / BSB-021) TaxID=946362 RepID=F2USX5_SALR5|nr:MC family transporter [Salpingoeca rosetta]EGD81234.1 MC family transporter [Salpingoeca rosetta]|eukprot:XP_004987768.1 MC family transporter [Salpingoeca rosetta]